VHISLDPSNWIISQQKGRFPTFDLILLAEVLEIRNLLMFYSCWRKAEHFRLFNYFYCFCWSTSMCTL